MKLKQYLAADFALAIKRLLPSGNAWDWPVDGFGYALLLASSQELARINANIQMVLDKAIETHHPKGLSWTLEDYRQVANDALTGVAEVMPRKPFAVGSHIGQRLWSQNAAFENFPISLVKIDHLVGPARIGSRVGDALWGHRSRYILRVRYYRSVVDPKVLWDALMAFKQAHVYLWFEDITGVGAEVNYGQN